MLTAQNPDASETGLLCPIFKCYGIKTPSEFETFIILANIYFSDQ